VDTERQVKEMASYQKAYFCPYRDGRPVLEERFYVPFNPAELSIDEAIGVDDVDEDDMSEQLKKLFENSRVGWQRPAGSTHARKRKGRVTLSVSLFFNTLNDLHQSSYEDVRQYVSQLYPYTNKDPDAEKGVEQIYFFWGSIAVAGVLNRMHVNYTMFAPDGKPVRAQVEISITGDYIGDASYSSSEGSATGDTTGISSGAAKGMMEKGLSQWRSQYTGSGNPRL